MCTQRGGVVWIWVGSRRLNLSWNWLEPDGGQTVLSALSQHVMMTELNLCGNKFTKVWSLCGVSVAWQPWLVLSVSRAFPIDSLHPLRSALHRAVCANFVGRRRSANAIVGHVCQWWVVARGDKQFVVVTGACPSIRRSMSRRSTNSRRSARRMVASSCCSVAFRIKGGARWRS